MRVFTVLSTMFVSFLSFSANASLPYVELTHLSAPQATEKIEVVELFSYRCGHCFNLEPALALWVDSLPDDVIFKRVPAMFGGQWDELGQLFLTLETMGAAPEVHQDIFRTVQKRQRLSTDEEMADFLEGVGVDREKFLATFHSFVVSGKVMAAKNKIKDYKISGVPAMVVNNKYTFDLSVGGAEKMFSLATELLNKERHVQAL
ncbi:thiol:disulfide interchange protein DsbA/DsbL [Pseudomonas canadensis]|uniref:thiol:disulfide interchange protein DsbA/DsbL n=1 Tax=Pseudomonas canadensis TaxID=915099 RepID=UPI003BA15031